MIWRRSNIWPFNTSFPFYPSFPVSFSHPSLSYCFPDVLPLNFLLLYSPRVQPALFPPLTHISCNLQRDAKVLCILAWKMDEWFAAFVWLCLVCAECLWVIDTVYACLWEIWCKQNKLSFCCAVFLMFCPKKKNTNTL